MGRHVLNSGLERALDRALTKQGFTIERFNPKKGKSDSKDNNHKRTLTPCVLPIEVYFRFAHDNFTPEMADAYKKKKQHVKEFMFLGMSYKDILRHHYGRAD